MSLFRRYLFLFALAASAIACLPAQASDQDYLMSLDSPIKVGGGAMTFYSKYEWHSYGKSPDQFCAVADSASQVLLSNFDRKLTLLNTGMDWTMTMTTTRGRKITLQQISQGTCNQQTGTILVVTLPRELRPYTAMLSKRGIRNHFRLRDQGCNAADPDLCERLDNVTLNNRAFDCNDLDCSVYLGSQFTARLPVKPTRSTPKPGHR